MSSLLKIHARYRLFSTVALLGLLWSLSACGYKGELRHPESSYRAGELQNPENPSPATATVL